MYIGVDHGTTSLRFATETGKHLKISREAAKSFELSALEKICPINEIEGFAVCYSMGDTYCLKNRGVIRDGARTIGGTRFSGMQWLFLIGSDTDPRFKVYSHQTSPEKLGSIRRIQLSRDKFFVYSENDNTVSFFRENTVGAAN